MPLDTAINNIGEYYAAHYLEGQFAKDIADKLEVTVRKALGIATGPQAELAEPAKPTLTSGSHPPAVIKAKAAR